MAGLTEAQSLLEEVVAELASKDPDYAWIAKVMTRERNIKLIAKAIGVEVNEHKNQQ